MIKVIESSGDIRLTKFIFIPMDKDKNYPSHYDYFLNGYFIKWSYYYNKLTRDTNDQDTAHADVIDSLPFTLKKQMKKCGIWGKTDWFIHGVNFYISDNSLTDVEIDYIKNLIGYKGK